MERLHEQEVPFAPVYGTDEVLADPQVRHLGSMTFFPRSVSAQFHLSFVLLAALDAPRA